MSNQIVAQTPADKSSRWAVLRVPAGRPCGPWTVEACEATREAADAVAAKLRTEGVADILVRGLDDPTLPAVAEDTPHTASGSTHCAWCHIALGLHQGKWFEVDGQFVGNADCARRLHAANRCAGCGERCSPGRGFCVDCGPAAGGLLTAARSAPQIVLSSR
jgi:hypothetical protein